MSHRLLVAARSTNARRLLLAMMGQKQPMVSPAAGGVSRTALQAFSSYSHLHGICRNDTVGCCRFNSSVIADASRTTSSSSSSHSTYTKPRNVELWEELASKELSKSNMTVDSLRTERVTPVSTIALLLLIIWVNFVDLLHRSHSFLWSILIATCKIIVIVGGHCHSASLL
jgi:hypothetical protein